MDKMEILKLALAHAPDPKSAMELAREMEAFLKGVNPVPKWVVETVTGMAEPNLSAPIKPLNYKRSWSSDEINRLSNLIQEGKTILQISEILGRSHNAIDTALNRISRGEYKPTLTQQVNAGRFPGHSS